MKNFYLSTLLCFTGRRKREQNKKNGKGREGKYIYTCSRGDRSHERIYMRQISVCDQSTGRTRSHEQILEIQIWIWSTYDRSHACARSHELILEKRI